MGSLGYHPLVSEKRICASFQAGFQERASLGNAVTCDSARSAESQTSAVRKHPPLGRSTHFTSDGTITNWRNSVSEFQFCHVLTHSLKVAIIILPTSWDCKSRRRTWTILCPSSRHLFLEHYSRKSYFSHPPLWQTSLTLMYVLACRVHLNVRSK